MSPIAVWCWNGAEFRRTGRRTRSAAMPLWKGSSSASPGLALCRRYCSVTRGREVARELAMRHEIIPNLRYADAPRAIEFLCDAFGFERRAVYLDDQNPHIVHHAQLSWGDRMVM